MPQMMPIYWVICLFMSVMILLILLDMFYYMFKESVSLSNYFNSLYLSMYKW